MQASLSEQLSVDVFVEQLNDAFSRGLKLRFTPSGTSMLPTIIGGQDTVTLSKPDVIRKYDAVLFRRETGELVLHRVIALNGDQLTISGDNQYWTEEITRNDVLAVVTALEHNGEEVKLSQPSYRLRIRLLVLNKRLRIFLSRVYHSIFK